MFKVNCKDTRTMPCSSVSIVNFEHVNASWVKTDQKMYYFVSAILSTILSTISSYLRIPKVSTSLLIFLATQPSLTQQRKQMKSNYNFD